MTEKHDKLALQIKIRLDQRESHVDSILKEALTKNDPELYKKARRETIDFAAWCHGALRALKKAESNH